MTARSIIVLSMAAAALTACQRPAAPVSAETPHVLAATDVAAGRYLVMTGGCNDCHTPNYARTGGKVPETEWLKGQAVGYHGAWGTSYPNNLRRTVAGMTEDAFVEMLSTREGLPPMPWPSVRAMAEADKRALYRYIKSLPLEGDPAPMALPPGQTPATPYEDMTMRVPGAPAQG
ncbi:cytochrome C [Brevundimonas sp. Leaf363]|uniref:cytochrome C n=1 Tax=Brevundimonas sp. Leaf363 TaxID=1736353 RepID=UPI000AAA6A5D|nr:cytochrome C [Brevundimonas sp. Leaf363]